MYQLSWLRPWLRGHVTQWTRVTYMIRRGSLYDMDLVKYGLYDIIVQVAVAPFGRLSDCCLQCAPPGRYPIDQEVLPTDRLEQSRTCAAERSAPLRGAGQSD